MSDLNRKRLNYYLRTFVVFTITFILSFILKAPGVLVTTFIILLLCNIFLVEIKIKNEQPQK